MHIILNISDSDKHFDTAINEYTKRLWKSIKIENIKPFKDSNQELVIQKETDKIIEILKKKYQKFQKVFLVKEWEMLDTHQFKDLVSNKDTVFIIWWPYWLDFKKIEKFVDNKISFGKITLPHWIAKLTLLEQIYRAYTIDIGKKYHY